MLSCYRLLFVRHRDRFLGGSGRTGRLQSRKTHDAARLPDRVGAAPASRVARLTWRARTPRRDGPSPDYRFICTGGGAGDIIRHDRAVVRVAPVPLHFGVNARDSAAAPAAIRRYLVNRRYRAGKPHVMGVPGQARETGPTGPSCGRRTWSRQVGDENAIREESMRISEFI